MQRRVPKLTPRDEAGGETGVREGDSGDDKTDKARRGILARWVAATRDRIFRVDPPLPTVSNERKRRPPRLSWKTVGIVAVLLCVLVLGVASSLVANAVHHFTGVESLRQSWGSTSTRHGKNKKKGAKRKAERKPMYAEQLSESDYDAISQDGERFARELRRAVPRRFEGGIVERINQTALKNTTTSTTPLLHDKHKDGEDEDDDEVEKEEEDAVVPRRALIPGKKLIPTMPRVVISKKTNRRMFGCLRETCRGLEIEDLLDRVYTNRFRTALANNSEKSYRDLEYRVTFLLTDTTQLNHMKSTAPELYKKIAHTYEGASYVVAFEGGDAMGGNKGFQLRIKDRFTRAFGCDYSTLEVQPAQYRLYVKSECEALLANDGGGGGDEDEEEEDDDGAGKIVSWRSWFPFSLFFSSSVSRRRRRPLATSSSSSSGKKRKKTWLLKPEAGSQGQGITFHTSTQEIVEKHREFFPCQQRHGIAATKRFLVQEYIQAPLLLKKCKFDARVYMFISSSNPFLIWYHRGYLRRSLTPYSPTSRERKAYLTNTHFQSMRHNFNMSEHVWTFDRMQATLTGRTGPSVVSLVIEPNIKEIARFVFESAREKIVPRRGANQMIGLDFMLDEELRLHFIEANGYPGFTWSINFDSRGMVEDLFDLLMEQSEAPGPFRALRPGDRFGGFHLIHSDAHAHMSYDPCEALGDNSFISRVVNRASRSLITRGRSASAKKGKKSEASKNDAGTKEEEEGDGLPDGEDAKSVVKPPSPRESVVEVAGIRATEDDDDDDDDDTESKRLSTTHRPLEELLSSRYEASWDVRKRALGCATTPTTTSSSGDTNPAFFFSARNGARLWMRAECEAFFKRARKGVPIILKPVAPSVPSSSSSPPLKPRLYPDAEALRANHLPSCATYTSKTRWTAEDVVERPLLIPLERVAFPGGREFLPPFTKVSPKDASYFPKTGAYHGQEEYADDPVVQRAEHHIQKLFGGGDGSSHPAAGLRYDVRVFAAIIVSPPPASLVLVFSRLGYARTVRRVACDSYQSFRGEEDVVSMEEYQDLLSNEEIAGSEFVTSVLEPYTRRVLEALFRDAEVWGALASSSTSITKLFSFDFVITEDLKPVLVDAEEANTWNPRIPTPYHAFLARLSTEMNSSMRRAGEVAEKAPGFFARARRGDAFEGFRIVVNGMEERRWGRRTSPDEVNLCKLKYPAIDQLKAAIKIENLKHKTRMAIHRDLKKRVMKKWSMCIHSRKKREKAAECMKPLLSELYRRYIKKERLVSDESNFVEMSVQELMTMKAEAGAGGNEVVEV